MFAQDIKKDSAQLYNYGARIFDPRLATYTSVSPQQKNENNPYQFADTTIQVATEPKENITTKNKKHFTFL
jgi:hypothetical protein